jgi:hypothetical protein
LIYWQALLAAQCAEASLVSFCHWRWPNVLFGAPEIRPLADSLAFSLS